MKVLQINSVCGVGSTGRIATDIADLLLARGDECKIAYGRGSAPEKDKNLSVSIGTFRDNLFHVLLTRLFDAHGFGSRSATKKFLKWVDEYDPDLIHLHNIHGYYLNIPLLFDYLKKKEKPVVWTLHDCWAMTGHCYHFSAIGCGKYKTQCHACPQLKEYPSTFSPFRVKKNFKQKKRAFQGVKDLTIITPSHWLADITKTSFLKDYPIYPIYNGVDLDLFKPTKSDLKKRLGIEDKIMLLGAAGSWVEKKGMPDFKELSARLDPKYALVIAGLKPEQFDYFPENVIRLPRTESLNELVELYSAADIFINPSVEETMGLTTAEALACGTPVITYNKTAVPEVPDETCGIVVEPGVENILEALEKINFSEEACRKRAENFEKNSQYEKYIKIYDEIIKKGK